MTIYDSRAIQEILPHRYPFLLVDKIIELEPRVRIVGVQVQGVHIDGRAVMQRAPHRLPAHGSR